MFNDSYLRRGAASVLCLATSVVALAASAQGAEDGPTATLICRHSLPSEAPTAKMIDEGALLVCRPFGVSVRMSDGSLKTIGSVTAKPQSGPDFTGALTADQVAAAWTRWVQQALRIDPATVHTP